MSKNILTLRISRFNKKRDPSNWVEAFLIEKKEGMNLLEALFKIRDEQDGSLGFRYSCRGAVCGSCGMNLNGKPVLACRTILEKLKEDVLFIEPLSNFPVIYDLIVDMTIFFQHHRSINPYFFNDKHPPFSEYIMEEEKRKLLDPYIQCIHCGICYTTCPAFGRNKNFLGPAILSKAYRFYADTRNERFREMLSKVDSLSGVWGCNTVFKCENVCPKDVPSTHAILNLRRGILGARLILVKNCLKRFLNKIFFGAKRYV